MGNCWRVDRPNKQVEGNATRLIEGHSYDATQDSSIGTKLTKCQILHYPRVLFRWMCVVLAAPPRLVQHYLYGANAVRRLRFCSMMVV
jgi:hypothetical protein